MTMDIPPPKAKMSKVKELADEIEYYELIAKGGKHESGSPITDGEISQAKGLVIELTAHLEREMKKNNFYNQNPNLVAIMWIIVSLLIIFLLSSV